MRTLFTPWQTCATNDNRRQVQVGLFGRFNLNLETCGCAEGREKPLKHLTMFKPRRMTRVINRKIGVCGACSTLKSD